MNASISPSITASTLPISSAGAVVLDPLLRGGRCRCGSGCRRRSPSWSPSARASSSLLLLLGDLEEPRLEDAHGGVAIAELRSARSGRLTTMLVGRCVIRTAESAVLTPCPPGPEERKTSTRRSSSRTLTSTSSHLRVTADTEAKLVWRRLEAVEGRDADESVHADLAAQVPVGVLARSPRSSPT